MCVMLTTVLELSKGGKLVFVIRILNAFPPTAKQRREEKSVAIISWLKNKFIARFFLI